MTQSLSKLLYVEDEVIVAIDMAERLSTTFGLDVKLVHTLAAADALAKEDAFDYAVLDLNLGHNERSTDLGRTLAAQGCRVVYVTGYNSVEVGEDGDIIIVEKPFDLVDLKQALDLPDP